MRHAGFESCSTRSSPIAARRVSGLVRHATHVGLSPVEHEILDSRVREAVVYRWGPRSAFCLRTAPPVTVSQVSELPPFDLLVLSHKLVTSLETHHIPDQKIDFPTLWGQTATMTTSTSRQSPRSRACLLNLMSSSRLTRPTSLMAQVLSATRSPRWIGGRVSMFHSTLRARKSSARSSARQRNTLRPGALSTRYFVARHLNCTHTDILTGVPDRLPRSGPLLSSRPLPPSLSSSGLPFVLLHSSPRPPSLSLMTVLWTQGDTGYSALPADAAPNDHTVDLTRPVCPAFKEMGKHFDGIDLALIPIGAYGVSLIFFLCEFFLSRLTGLSLIRTERFHESDPLRSIRLCPDLQGCQS